MIPLHRGCRLPLGPALAMLSVGIVAFAHPFGGTALASTARYTATCTTPNIAVVVQFPDGRGTKAGCASSASNPTGWAVLVNGGFAVQGTIQFPSSFVCRIDGYPDSTCANTPPRSDSWAYWYANPGERDWTFSPAGAADRTPRAGSVDAWTFGGGRPSIPPAAVLPTAALSPPAAPTPTQPVKGGTPGMPAPSTKAAGPGTLPDSTGPGSTTGTAVPPAGTNSPSTSATLDGPITPASSLPPSAGDAPSTADRHASRRNSAVPTVVAAILLAMIAAGGFATRWWRRSRAGR